MMSKDPFLLSRQDSPLSFTVQLFTKRFAPKVTIKTNLACAIPGPVKRYIPCWRWMEIMCFSILRLLIISGFLTSRSFLLEGSPRWWWWWVLLSAVPLWFDFLFDLGKTIHILNFSIQLWNSVFIFAMEIGSVTNTSVHLWTSKRYWTWRFVVFKGDETSRILEVAGCLVTMACVGRGWLALFPWALPVVSTAGRILNQEASQTP